MSSNSSSGISRKESERTKLMQEKCQTLLTQMLRDEDNKYCVDCDAKGPRWSSWNLGVFLCIRCAGIHRNLGVHISRVKSVNLDTWTPEQVISLQQMGNSRARAVYEAQLPDGFRRPQTDTALENFIRAKYEHKKYLAREWVPPSPPKVDWAKEIDDELEKQKRKKKSTQAASLGTLGGNITNAKKKTSSTNITKSPLPAPLPKPKSSSSPKTHRNSDQQTSNAASLDLLGLSSPPTVSTNSQSNDTQNDSFTGFLSAPPLSNGSANPQDKKQTTKNPSGIDSSGPSSLAKEEEDFFNQTSLVGNEKDKSGKLTKDSILALYATGPTNPQNSLGQFNNNPLGGGFNNFMTMPALQSQQQPNSFPTGFPHQQQQQQQHQQQHQQQQQPQQIHSQFGAQNMNLAGMPPGILGPSHHQQPQVQTQFMTPPNSVTMYNAPVMTAPAAFTSAAAGAGAGHHPMMGMQQSTGGFAQFPPMQVFATSSPYVGSHIMATGHSSLPNSGFAMSQQNQISGPPSGPSTSLNQQFDNLNLGNVWQ